MNNRFSFLLKIQSYYFFSPTNKTTYAHETIYYFYSVKSTSTQMKLPSYLHIGKVVCSPSEKRYDSSFIITLEIPLSLILRSTFAVVPTETLASYRAKPQGHKILLTLSQE